MAACLGLHGEEATALHGFHQAVRQAVELGVPRPNIRGETRPRIVKRVDYGERASTGQTTRGHVRGEKLPELSF